MLSEKKQVIIDFVQQNKPVDRATIYSEVSSFMGDSTLRRLLLEMTPELIKANGLVEQELIQFLILMSFLSLLI